LSMQLLHLLPNFNQAHTRSCAFENC
jgi:hypothetical protein